MSAEPEAHAARKALADLGATAQNSAELHGGRAAAAALAGLSMLYLRDLPADELKRIRALADEIVRDYDQHAATRGEA